MSSEEPNINKLSKPLDLSSYAQLTVPWPGERVSAIVLNEENLFSDESARLFQTSKLLVVEGSALLIFQTHLFPTTFFKPVDATIPF